MPAYKEKVLGAIRDYQPCTLETVADSMGLYRPDVRACVLTLTEEGLVTVGADLKLRTKEGTD